MNTLCIRVDHHGRTTTFRVPLELARSFRKDLEVYPRDHACFGPLLRSIEMLVPSHLGESFRVDTAVAVMLVACYAADVGEFEGIIVGLKNPSDASWGAFRGSLCVTAYRSSDPVHPSLIPWELY